MWKVLGVLLATLFMLSPVFAATVSLTLQSPTNTTYVVPTIGGQSMSINLNFTTNFTGFSNATAGNYTSPIIACYWSDWNGTDYTEHFIDRTADYHSCINLTLSWGVGQHWLRMKITATEINDSSTITNYTFRNFTVATNATLYNATESIVLTDVLVPILNDTWVSNGENAVDGCNRSFSMGGSSPGGTGGTWPGTNVTTNHGTDSFIVLDAAMLYQYCWQAAADIYSLWKFNVSNATSSIGNTTPTPANIYQQKIISDFQVKLDSVGGCNNGPTNHTLYWHQNAGDWEELGLTYSNCGSVCTQSQISKSSDYIWTGSNSYSRYNMVNSGEPNNFFSNPAFIAALYSQDFVTVGTTESFAGTGCNPQLGWGSMHWTQTREYAPTTIYMNATLSDTFTTGMDYPGFACQFPYSLFCGGCCNPYFYWDFETSSINSQGGLTSFNPQSQSFAQADFRYDVINNVITPQNGATAVIFPCGDGTCNGTDNNLDAVTCSGMTGYSTAPLPSPNTNPNTYNIYCFNLSSSHRGYPYYAAIKVLNVDDGAFFESGDFSFFSQLFGPGYTTVSDLTRTPFVVDPGVNVTFTWTSSSAMTTGLQVSYYDPVADQTYGPNTYQTDGNLTLSHTAVISGLTIQAARQFSVRGWGTDALGQTHYSSSYNTFTVTGVAGNLTEEQSLNNAFTNFTGSYVLFLRDASDSSYLSGACTLIEAPCTLHSCGLANGNCITYNNTVPPCGSGQSYCNYYCTNGITSCNYTGITYECNDPGNGPFTQTTWPAGSSPEIMFNGILTTAPYIAIPIGSSSSESFAYSPFSWNYTCSADEHQTTSGQFLISPSTTLPTFISVYLPRNPICHTGSIYTTSQQSCEVYMANQSVPAWYCAYDPNRCSTIENGVCTYGTWVGYECDSPSVIPGGFPVNGSAFPGQVPNGTTSIIPAITDPLAAILGIPTWAVLGFLAMLISTIGAAVAGMKAKHSGGVVSGVTFIGLLLMFTFLQWIPIWVLVIMAVLVAFLIARFAVGIIGGGGGG